MLRRAALAGTVFGAGIYVGSAHPDKIAFYVTKVSSTLGVGGTKSQAGGDGVASAQQLLDKALEITKDSGPYAVLSTVNEFGGVSSRLIQPCGIEGSDEDPRLYFNTNQLSRKAAEMSANPKVTLTYVNNKRMAYVCWRGDAKKIEPPAHKNHWREWLRVFYPEGPDGGRFSTWVIVPSAVEQVCITENVVSRSPQDIRPPTIVKEKQGDVVKGWTRTD